MRKFWHWVRNETEGGEARTLFLNGVIAEETWFEDDVTPAAFKSELMAGDGAVTVVINSPGGDCIAASQIYCMLMDYPHPITVKIDGLAASAASVIAMAGETVLMAPTAMMMIHNPLTIAMGDTEEMRRAIQMLNETKESIINAYELKTKLPRERISKLMDAETWMSAKKAMEYGFADGMLYEGDEAQYSPNSYAFSCRAVTNSLMNKIKPQPPSEPEGPRASALQMRLALSQFLEDF